jgi:hypothetical protein
MIRNRNGWQRIIIENPIKGPGPSGWLSQGPRFPDEWFRRTLLTGSTPAGSDSMLSQDTPDILDALIAASLQARREKLQRRLRNQTIRLLIALGLSVCVALFALAAYLIGDHAAARSLAMTAYLVFGFTCVTGLAARKRAVDALREADRP